MKSTVLSCSILLINLILHTVFSLNKQHFFFFFSPQLGTSCLISYKSHFYQKQNGQETKSLLSLLLHRQVNLSSLIIFLHSSFSIKNCVHQPFLAMSKIWAVIYTRHPFAVKKHLKDKKLWKLALAVHFPYSVLNKQVEM